MRLQVEAGDTARDVVCVENPGGAGWFTQQLAFDVKGDQVVLVGLGSRIDTVAGEIGSFPREVLLRFISMDRRIQAIRCRGMDFSVFRFRVGDFSTHGHHDSEEVLRYAVFVTRNTWFGRQADQGLDEDLPVQPFVPVP